MKTCPTCNSQLEDSATFCAFCGSPQPASAPAPAPEEAAPQQAYAPQPDPGAQQQQYQQPYQQQYQQPTAYPPVADSNDHTAEYDPTDIANNKLYAIAVYLLGPIGIIIALLANKDSAFLQFHIKQSLRLTIAISIVAVLTFALSWTLLVPLAGSIFLCILGVIEIICFVNVCKGKAKDAPIVSSWNFLK